MLNKEFKQYGQRHHLLTPEQKRPQPEAPLLEGQQLALFWMPSFPGSEESVGQEHVFTWSLHLFPSRPHSRHLRP